MESGINIAPHLTSSLLSWYDAHRRDLPWRDHPDPYGVLISEIMLQQTTVPAVMPYFQRWMEKYPDVHTLAVAAPEEVLLQWEGLGYYSRARNLHAAAREITHQYGGLVPSDPQQLKKLPGIGDYTAAAVASIAFGVRVPALDANNIRVWSRLLTASDRKRIIGVFAKVIPADRPGDFNQALMDLGSSICTPKNPECPACPLVQWCRALKTGTVSLYPEKKSRPDTEFIEAAIGIIVNRGKVLVQRRPDTGLMAGLWEFPGGKIGKTSGEGEGERGRGGEKSGNGETGKPFDKLRAERGNGEENHELTAKGSSPTLPLSHSPTLIKELPEEAVVREVREETGLRIQVCEKLGVFIHSYTRFRVKLHVFICRRKAGRMNNPRARWVTLEELEGLAMPSVNRRIVEALEKRLNTHRAD